MLILLYNDVFGSPILSPSIKTEGCEVTVDRRRYKEASAVVFHLPSLFDFPYSYLPWFCKRFLNVSSCHLIKLAFGMEKLSHQVWVGLWLECPQSLWYRRLLNNTEFLSCFDVYVNYKQDADVMRGYLPDSSEMAALKQPPSLHSKLISAFISSPLNKSGRLEYLKELMQHIPIDSYGKKLNTMSVKGIHRRHEGNQAKKNIIKDYKFTIAFENACEKDYVTEKFFEPLLAGSVPVYLGAPNIDEFAPGNHCFINAKDFRTPRSLAEHLLGLDRNDTLYQKYFQWKTEPLRPQFLNLVKQQENWVKHLVKAIKTRTSRGCC